MEQKTSSPFTVIGIIILMTGLAVIYISQSINPVRFDGNGALEKNPIRGIVQYSGISVSIVGVILFARGLLKKSKS